MKILLAEPHTIVREGLARIIGHTYPFSEITEAADIESLLQHGTSGEYKLLITAISIGSDNAVLQAIPRIKEASPGTAILVLTIHPAELYAVRSIRSGASGYLSKNISPAELISAINSVLSGRKYITPQVAELMADSICRQEPMIASLSNRELEVLRFLGKGHTIAEVAKMLCICRTTASGFRARILEKMNFHGNLELIRFAVENQLA